MTTYYAKNATMNLSDANAWNTAADGSGSDWTYEAGANVLNLNGKAVTLDVDVTVTEITSADAAGYLIVSTTRVINGGVSYSSSSTSGMVRIGTGGDLTVNGQSALGSNGYIYVLTGSGALALSNAGATAMSVSTGNGRVISSTSSGTITVVGAMTNGGWSSSILVYVSATGATVEVTGDATLASGNGFSIANATGTFLFTGACSTSAGVYGFSLSGGTHTIDGIPTGDATSTADTITVSNPGVLNLVGSHTIAASRTCLMRINPSGTLNLATASSALSLANSGTLIVVKVSGTLVTTAAGGTASIVNQDATSYAAFSGCTDAEKAIISSIGGGDGYTYGDNDASKVLTTATGAGTYQAVAAAEVRKGVAVGVSPAVGTLVGIVDSGGTQHDYGTCSSAQAYNATGVIYGSGSYATEASRNTDPGSAYVLTGHNYTIAGAAKTASYSPDFPDAGNVLSTDTVNGSSGTLTLPGAGYVLTSAWGGPAAFGVGGTGSTPTATLTAAENVWHAASAFGAAGTSITPAMVGSDITNLSAANVKKDVAIDDVTGTYDPMAAAVFPAEANVSTVETAYGPTGAEYAGLLDLSLYTLIAGVAAASDVRYGTSRYTGGATGTCYVPTPSDVKSGVNVDATTGTYPTTETSQAAQLASDIAEVEAQKSSILDTATILTVTGTNPGVTTITVTSQHTRVLINSQQVDLLELDVTPEA